MRNNRSPTVPEIERATAFSILHMSFYITVIDTLNKYSIYYIKIKRKINMSRSYNQNCALAHALDLLGDRWTLLIIRELLVGEKRFGKLLSNLEGMGTNLLAQRLRTLSEQGLINKYEQGYVLAAAGRRLEPMVNELIRFGLSLGIEDSNSRLTRPEWDVVALRALYDNSKDELPNARYLLEINGHPFCIEKLDADIQITQAACDNPRVTVCIDKTSARQISQGYLSVSDAIQSKVLTIVGSKPVATKLLRCFGMLD